MIKKFNDKNILNLAKAFVCIDNTDDCLDFLADLCTVSEVKAMAQRLEVAAMLNDRRVYSDIVAKTGASTATISRVNNALTYGEDGYKNVLEKLSAKSDSGELTEDD
ncbi:MAG: TrpR-like protein, YerC/YecD [Clostridia bacterium]|nr:TrpR-like protein, YerC/YecD [Clostridia bacterium]